MLDRYQDRIKNVDEGSSEFEYVVGVTLGFPECSARWFADMTKQQEEQGLEDLTPERKQYGIGVYWAGFTFVSNLRWLNEDIEWMWNTYHHPKAIGNALSLLVKEKGFLEIPFGNLQEVRKIKEEVMKNRGLISVDTK